MGVSLVVGAEGVLGRAVSRLERQAGHAVMETTRSRQDGSGYLDLETMPHTWAVPSQVTVAYICAAITSQHGCRADFSRAYEVNVTGTCMLVRRLVDAGVFVVFPSTNLVFDGTQPFVLPTATRCPRTVYGRMKAEAEDRLLALGGSVAVVRLSKVIHRDLPIFAEWQAAFETGLDVRPLEDMVLSPLSLDAAAALLVAVARSRTQGVVQASGSEDISYAEVCRVFAQRVGVPGCRVRPISWRESGKSFEHVPLHTTLDSQRASELCGFRPPKPLNILKNLLS